MLEKNCQVPLQGRRLADVTLNMLRPGLAAEGKQRGQNSLLPPLRIKNNKSQYSFTIAGKIIHTMRKHRKGGQPHQFLAINHKSAIPFFNVL